MRRLLTRLASSRAFYLLMVLSLFLFAKRTYSDCGGSMSQVSSDVCGQDKVHLTFHGDDGDNCTCESCGLECGGEVVCGGASTSGGAVTGCGSGIYPSCSPACLPHSNTADTYIYFNASSNWASSQTISQGGVVCGTISGISLSTNYADADGDGYDACEDCNDHNATIHPGAVDLCDGIDHSCSGGTGGGGLDCNNNVGTGSNMGLAAAMAAAPAPGEETPMGAVQVLPVMKVGRFAPRITAGAAPQPQIPLTLPPAMLRLAR